MVPGPSDDEPGGFEYCTSLVSLISETFCHGIDRFWLISGLPLFVLLPLQLSDTPIGARVSEVVILVEVLSVGNLNLDFRANFSARV